MKHHPEQQPDEIYMGNTTLDGVLGSSWKTSRLGNVALSSSGEPLETWDNYKPWFIKVSEVESAISMAKHENKPWGKYFIRAFQEMVDNKTAL